VEKGGTLKATVMPWNRLITDTVDFESFGWLQHSLKRTKLMTRS
jgi:hypothetical protein